MTRVLLVDDEVNVLQALKRLLARGLPEGAARVEVASDPREALARAEYIRFDVVVSDYRMPSMDGVSFLKAMRALQPDGIRLILSASTDFDTIMTAVNEAEIHRYLTKPWSDEEVVTTVREAIERHASLMEDKLLADEKRVEAGHLDREELERRRLEAENPGITKAKWGPDGSLLIDDD
ncbi:MAG: response regulator [Rhodocyclaceae bacterium]